MKTDGSTPSGNSTDSQQSSCGPASRIAHSKIVMKEQLLRMVAVWRAQHRKVVFTNGCFDVLHAGHVSLIEQAAALGDVLVVAVNSDASVRHAKGEGRPVNDQNHRTLALAGLPATDAVVAFNEDTPVELLEMVRPDVLVKGEEYSKEQVVGGAFVEGYGGQIVRTEMVEGVSTTGIIGRMKPQADAPGH